MSELGSGSFSIDIDDDDDDNLIANTFVDQKDIDDNIDDDDDDDDNKNKNKNNNISIGLDTRKAGVTAAAAIRKAAKLSLELEETKRQLALLRRRFVQEQRAASEKAEDSKTDSLEIRELKYRNKYLARELAETKRSLKETNLRTRAKMCSLSSTLKTTKDEYLGRQGHLITAAKAIQSTVMDLQRHLGSRGFHAVNSQVAQALMENIWSASEKLTTTCTGYLSDDGSNVFVDNDDNDDDDDDDDDIDDDDDYGYDCEYFERSKNKKKKKRRKKEKRKKKNNNNNNNNNLNRLASKTKDAALFVAAKDGHIHINGDSAAKELAREMTQICSRLETENQRLEAKVEMLESEVKSIRQHSKAKELIPKYRVAIVKSRNFADALRKQVNHLEQERSSTQKELEKQCRENRLLRQSLTKLKQIENKRKHLIATASSKLRPTPTPTPLPQDRLDVHDEIEDYDDDDFTDFAANNEEIFVVNQDIEIEQSRIRSDLDQLNDEIHALQNSLREAEANLL